MNDIISEFEKSGVADELSVFNNSNEDINYLQNGVEKDVVDSKIQLEETEIAQKTELDFVLEKDLSDIDFEISMDMFEEIKIEEDDVVGFVENVSGLSANDSQKNDTNFKLPFSDKNVDENIIISVNADVKKGSQQNETASNLVSANQQMEMAFEECIGIPFSPETEKIVEVNGDKSKVCSNLNNKIIRIMTELQTSSVLYQKEQIRNGYLGSNNEKPISNTSLIFQECSKNNESDAEECKGFIFNNKENISPSTSESGISYDDSVKAVIESVIQNAMKHDEMDLSKAENMNEKFNEKKRKRNSSMENDGSGKKPYGVFEVIVPLIGKNVLKLEDDVPFTHRYDLARKINEMRAKAQKNDPFFPIPSMSFEEWRKKKESRSKEEIVADERKKVISAVDLAKCFTKLAIRILEEYEKDEPNERAMIKYFRCFEFAPASPLSLLYSPHFVHTMMLCRGDEDLSYDLRKTANECYYKCHALFPIPEGYNFETVYTSEVKKYVPTELDHLDDAVLDYGDYDSSDFEDDSSDCSNDSDKDWE